ncbi:MAG: TolC family protein [Bacteroidetes bacterium]|nr:TolC family protein [Bacteroidota bacterium]
MTYLKILAGGLLSVLMTAGVVTAQVSEKQEFTLAAAIETALKNNRIYKVAEQDLEKSDLQINEAYGLAMPVISGSAQYTRNLKPSVFFITTDAGVQKLQIGADNAYQLGFTLQQPLFSKTVGTALEVAEIYKDYSQAGVNSSRLKTILDVKKAYYGVLLAKRYKDVSQKMLELTESNYKNVQAMYKEGVASEYDELRMSVQLANVRPQVLQTQNTYQIAVLNLKNQLGIDKEPIVVDEFKLELLPEDQITLASQRVTDQNSNLRQLTIQKNLLEKNVQIKESGLWPSLYAFGNLAWQAQADNFKFQNYDWIRSTSVGLNLSIPIFSGFQTVSQIQQAELEVKKLDYMINDLQSNLQLAVQSATYKLKEAKERVEAQGKAVGQAEKALSIAEIRFKNGVGMQLEILDAQLALNQALNNQAQATYDYLVAKADWQQLTGME